MFKSKPFWVQVIDREGDVIHYAQCTKAIYYSPFRVLKVIDNRPFLKGEIVLEVPASGAIKCDKGKIKVIN